MRLTAFVLLLGLICCEVVAQSVLQKEEQRVVKIDPRPTEDFFSFVFDYEVIPLTGDDDLLLPSLRLIGTAKNRIFATTRSFRGNRVYVFDQQGHLISTIKKVGRGPGEYIGVRGVIGYANGDFGLEDVSGQKILVFDSLGTYKEELKWEQLTYGMVGGREAYFSLLPEDLRERYGKVGVMNEQFGLDTAFFNGLITRTSRVNTGNELQAFMGGFSFMESNTPGVYHGNKEEVWPAYYFDFGPYAPEVAENGIPSFDNKVSLLSFYETTDCAYLQYAFGMKNYQLSVYSKRDGLVTNHALDELIGEELPGLSAVDSTWMYLPIPAPAVGRLIKKLKLEAATFANGLSAEEVLASENPVILRFRFF